MTSLKTAIARPNGPRSTTVTKNNRSLPSSIKQRLHIMNTGTTDIYQSEGSKVYTVMCILLVGMSLIGLGTGLIIYALNLTIEDLIIVGSIGIFIGIVLLLVAVAFLLKPMIERRQRNRQVATYTQKQSNISIAPGLSGYVYNNYNDINLQKADIPSNNQLYEHQEVSGRYNSQAGSLTVVYPSDDKYIPTYDVKMHRQNTVESIL